MPLNPTEEEQALARRAELADQFKINHLVQTGFLVGTMTGVGGGALLGLLLGMVLAQ